MGNRIVERQAIILHFAEQEDDLPRPVPLELKASEDMDKQTTEDNEFKEFDFYLQWEWPDHIEESLRRMLFVSLVEACEPGTEVHTHTTCLRWQIANYPESPAAVLDFLADFDDPALLIRIAENPNTGGVTLARLAQHGLPEVRVAVAEHVNPPFVVMKMLVADENPDVCYAMAENPALPAKLLRELTDHPNPYVATRASRTLNRRTPRKPEQFPLQYPPQTRKAE